MGKPAGGMENEGIRGWMGCKSSTSMDENIRREWMLLKTLHYKTIHLIHHLLGFHTTTNSGVV
jgi:hypothetical protein